MEIPPNDPGELDFVVRITKFCAAVTGMDEQQRLWIEDQIRQEYGGDRVGIIRRTSLAAIEARNAQIMAGFRVGEKYRSIAARLGISAATVCAVVAKKRREKKPVQLWGKN